jgi:hypothetical protein
MSDRLHDTLTTLRPDVERAALADSAAVRRRGNQRTRRQAAGSALAAVAIVAAAVGVASGLNGDDRAIDRLPATSGPTTAPAPTTDEHGTLRTLVLLQPNQLPTFPNQPLTVGQTFERATDADAAAVTFTACGAPPSGGVTPGSAVLRTFLTDADVRMWHWVAEYPTVGEAAQAVAALKAACTARGAAPVDVPMTDMPGTQAAFHAGRFTADPGSEYGAEVTGVIRTGYAVSVVGLRGMLRTTEVDMNAFDETLSQASWALTTR